MCSSMFIINVKESATMYVLLFLFGNVCLSNLKQKKNNIISGCACCSMCLALSNNKTIFEVRLLFDVFVGVAVGWFVHCCNCCSM